MLCSLLGADSTQLESDLEGLEYSLNVALSQVSYLLITLFWR